MTAGCKPSISRPIHPKSLSNNAISIFGRTRHSHSFENVVSNRAIRLEGSYCSNPPFTAQKSFYMCVVVIAVPGVVTNVLGQGNLIFSFWVNKRPLQFRF